MASKLNSDKVICGVLEEDCRLPEEVDESDSILVLATLLLLLFTIFSYFCMSSITRVLILAILIAIVLIFIVIDDKFFQ